MRPGGTEPSWHVTTTVNVRVARGRRQHERAIQLDRRSLPDGNPRRGRAIRSAEKGGGVRLPAGRITTFRVDGEHVAVRAQALEGEAAIGACRVAAVDHLRQ
jgi:hypothetical protein